MGKEFILTKQRSLQAISWNTQKVVFKTYAAETTLLIESDELNLLLIANNGIGVTSHLREVPILESAQRESSLRSKGLRRLMVDQARLVEAEAFLRVTRQARSASPLAPNKTHAIRFASGWTRLSWRNDVAMTSVLRWVLATLFVALVPMKVAAQ